MKLEVNDSKTVEAIKAEFNNMFPYLKIEFFSRPHEAGGGTEKKFIKDEHSTLFDCRTVHYNGPLEIQPEMKVTELEKNFQNVYGLSTQVFRRSGKVWLETINTDHWTLAQQNELGEFSVRELHNIKMDEL